MQGDNEELTSEGVIIGNALINTLPARCCVREDSSLVTKSI